MKYLAALFLLTVPAYAQAPNPARPSDPQLNFCQKAVTAVQAQRNTAQDEAARCGVQLEMTNEELAKARKDIEDLVKREPKKEEPKAEPKAEKPPTK